MMFKSAFRLAALSALSALVTNVASVGIGIHLATKGLIQMHPSFGGKGIKLFPAHRPDHDPEDLEHLIPRRFKELYYSQEGHRPALHGAKHASLKTNFTRPTVVLDHTSHLNYIRCGPGDAMGVCFSPSGFDQVQETWNVPEFHLVTFHVRCGDESTGARSYFLARNPEFDPSLNCVNITATEITQEEAIDSGELSWGTFKHPDYKKRVPVKGHVRLSKPQEDVFYHGTFGKSPNPQARSRRSTFPPFARAKHPPINSTFPGAYPFDPIENNTITDVGGYVDLTTNLTALESFFDSLDFDYIANQLHDPVTPEEDLGFIEFDGDVGDWEEEGWGKLRRRLSHAHAHNLEERGIVEFFRSIYEACKKFVQAVASWIKSVFQEVTKIAKLIIAVAVTVAKLLAVPFGVPFDESYQNDFNFTKTLTGGATNKPPAIFGYEAGFSMASSGGYFDVQCAKCGIHGDFEVEGRLAFSIQDGITEGYAALTNNDYFTIDAIFGVTLAAQYDKPIKVAEKQLAAVPLSPLSIPGIITLGPQVSISTALNLNINGKAVFLVGGSLSIAPGEARLSLVDKSANKFIGFDTKFTPVAKFQKDGLVFTAAVELGLPVALEVGLDVLNGKWKKTVGLVNKPSVYGSATLNLGTDLLCNNGITLGFGMRNSIYVTALDLWDYTIRTDDLFFQEIACVQASGFDSKLGVPNPTIFTTVPTRLGEDIAKNPPNISDLAKNLTNPKKNNEGFRVVMDYDKTSILVSGKDGYVYLTTTDSKYDTSSPWGSTDLRTDSLSLDVFGRVLSYIPDQAYKNVAEIKVWTPTKVPWNYKNAALTVLKTPDTNYNTYGLVATYHGVNATYYPTFCKTAQGLRLYATYYIINKDGKIDGNIPTDWQQTLFWGFQDFNITTPLTDCRTVRLVAV